MCGIFGVVTSNNQVLPQLEMLQAMAKTLRQRGPDDEGIHIQGRAGLGATRLSIIDLPHGNQPLFNEDRTIWVVQNGELYNYRELKKLLTKRGHRFLTSSDTEVYAHAYEEWGLSFVEKLRGMYALALWDEKRERLVLVRDRLGIKPLYYAQQNGQFIFASEIKAILPTGIKRTLDRQALADYLSVNYVPGPRSIFTGIEKLPPAHVLEWINGKRRIYSYWKSSTLFGAIQGQKGFVSNEVDEMDEGALRARLISLVEEAVKYHLVSDVPVGAFLSGGIDSSAVVALASRLYPKKLRTFSVGFDEKSYDERTHAQHVADQFGTKHESIALTLKPVELVEKIGTYLDEPFADSSAVAVYAISEVARKEGMKVILTGDGGDEVFGGYVTYQADQLLQWYNRLPRWLREGVISRLVNVLPASQKKMAFDFKVKRFVRGATDDPLLAHFLWKAIFTDQQLKKLLATHYTTRPCSRLWQNAYDSMHSSDTLNKLMLTDLKTSLPDDMLTKVDRMSMANSLEVRVPLLDHPLIEFMASLPSRYKVRGMTLKYLFKKSLRGLLPDNILDRPKAGFHVPVTQWLNGELQDMIGDYLSPARLKREGYFKPAVVAEVLDDHRNKKADYAREIWGLLMFEIWRDHYLL